MNKTTELYSTRELTIALACGIIKADPFYSGYETPPGYERVLHDFAQGFQDIEDEHGAFELDPDELKQNIRQFIHSHPICKGWNHWDGADDNTIGIITRYTPAPKTREFIDLDAICQNTVATLRDHRETFKRFNDDFDKRWKENHPDAT